MFHAVKCGSGPCPVIAPRQITKNTPAPVVWEEWWFSLGLVTVLVKCSDNMEGIKYRYIVQFALQCM